MGILRHAIETGPIRGERFETLEALVDADATYTRAPRGILKRLGISSECKRRFQMADGAIIDRDVAQALARIDGRELYTQCIFGDEGSTPLLGAYTLEGFGLGVAPVKRRLMPVPGYLTGAN